LTLRNCPFRDECGEWMDNSQPSQKKKEKKKKKKKKEQKLIVFLEYKLSD
jgi:adenine-specific DNA glycosylase